MTPPKPRLRPNFRLNLCSTLICLTAAAAGLTIRPTDCVADEPTKKQIEFFEKKIRPILTDHCFECHSAEKQESDLRLDSRAAILAGGASGPAANPDDPEGSLIIDVLRYSGDVEMPPDQKLDDKVIGDIQNWIKMGLPWPKKKEDDQVVPLSMKERVDQHRTKHWAFQPLKQTPHQRIANDQWSRNHLDTLILKKLRDRQLTPSPEADRYILTRRLYLSLIGIPPTYEEAQAIANDESEDWYENLVDRLLSSPRYGERWGRHWLDVARYADTRGYSFQRDRNYPHAYTYRDYVINAWNEDKPYDVFVREQLAADQLELGDDLTPLAALGYLTVGRKFNNVHDDVDDKIDVVFRGLQGLTVSCARCHDHKYDAIPTEDYYSLYGVFISSNEGSLPYIGPRDQVESFKAQKSKLDAEQKKLNDFLSNKRNLIVDTARVHTDVYLARVLGFKEEEIGSLYLENEKPIRVVRKIVRAWRDYIGGQANDSHPVWFPWKALTDIKDPNQFTARAKELIQSWKSSKKKINPLLLEALQKSPLESRLDIARIYGQVISDVYEAWKKAGSNDRGLAKLSEPQRQIGILLFTDRTPTEIKTGEITAYLSETDQAEHERIKAGVEKVKQELPPELDRAMVVTDIPTPVQPVVFIRGQAGRRGKKVPRQFIEVLSPANRKPFTRGSGRLEIAEQITHPDNPLTARVLVNRVWMGLMGQSLVATPSDFGTRCPEPIQRDVLDTMAGELIKNDWSIKSLQRMVLLSSTFRQSSVHRDQPAEVDVSNSLYWRANRQRLEFEPLRDSMLAVSTELDLSMGGKSVEITKRPFAKRRAVYGYIDRQDLPNLLRAFDFASPDQSSAQRTQTTVPQQLLFMMNSPFVIQRAQVVADRLADADTPEQTSRQLYRLVLARDPTMAESKVAIDYLQRESANPSRVRNLAQILLLTNEFSFVD